jgi:hypothetical protein
MTKHVEVPTSSIGTDELPEILVKELPSKFLPYPENASIYYLPYSWGDVKNISQSKINTKDFFIKVLAGIRTDGFEVLDLTVQDFLYIALLRKLSSFGAADAIEVTFKCPACLRASLAKVMLRLVSFEELKVPALPITLQTSKGERIFSPLTLRRYFELFDMKMDENVDAMIAACCTNVADIRQVMDEQKKSTGMDMELYATLAAFFDYGVLPVEVKCENKMPAPVTDPPTPDAKDTICGTTIKLLVDGGGIFIRPFRGSEDNLESRIRFGKAPAHT